MGIFLPKPESSLISCNILPGISDHRGVLLEVELDEICREPKVERIVSVYHKTDVLGLQTFLREKFNLWAGNGSCVQEIRKSYKDIIFEGIKRYLHSVQQKPSGLIFHTSRSGSDVTYSYHHKSSRVTFPIFVHSRSFSFLHSLQSITLRIVLTKDTNTFA